MLEKVLYPKNILGVKLKKNAFTSDGKLKDVVAVQLDLLTD